MNSVYLNANTLQSRASAEKFPGGGGGNGKRLKNSKKDQKNSTIKPFHGGPMEKIPKNSKKDRKIALLSLSVPRVKIQGGRSRPLPFPRCRRP